MDSSEAASVTNWFHRLEASDDDAAQKLWNRYFDRLVQLAQSKNRQVDGDGEGVASSVFASLWRGARAGRFRSVENRDELWRLLLRLTQMKVADDVRRRTAQKRGSGIPHVSLTPTGESAQGDEYLMANDPSHEELVALDEQFNRLLSELQDDQLRQIALLRLEGYSYEEIAEYLSVSTATVARKLRLIRGTWNSEFDE